MNRELAEKIVDSHLSTSHAESTGTATCVYGLPEEVVAMVFAFFSRNPRSMRETLINMVEDGNLPLTEPYDSIATTEKARKFHERTTIGYGHKSVADHAQIHWALEGVSAVAERDWLSARLLAATSKSTRYVDFRNAGFAIHTDEGDVDDTDEMEAHCTELLNEYEKLIEPATIAVRKIMPYDGPATEIWSEKGWERATSKRALDMVRDLLPSSIRTSFGVTCSATALVEMCHKRISDERALEVHDQANMLLDVCRTAAPTLLEQKFKNTPRYKKIVPKFYVAQERTRLKHKIEVVARPRWDVIQTISDAPINEIIKRWTEDRGHHLPPDRTAEQAVYILDCVLPWAIHRDLGRHRMMTQIEGALSPNLGYGCDPLLQDHSLMMRHPELAVVAMAHTKALARADSRLVSMSTRFSNNTIQYLCPLAAMVPVRYVINVRELVHLLGLRTIVQGHASYRLFTQMLARRIKQIDPIMTRLVDEVTNYDNVVVGRPG